MSYSYVVVSLFCWTATTFHQTVIKHRSFERDYCRSFITTCVRRRRYIMHGTKEHVFENLAWSTEEQSSLNPSVRKALISIAKYIALSFESRARWLSRAVEPTFH